MQMTGGTTAEDKTEKAEAIMTLGQAKLIEMLKSAGASEFARAKACQQLAVVGTAEAVPALAALLADPKLAHYARFGLEPIPDPSADDALRRALATLNGRSRIGVIHSIGNRKDAMAVGALAKLSDDSDVEVAAAAIMALGRIGSPDAAARLEQLLKQGKVAIRPAAAGACLECAEGLLAQGRPKEARSLYDAVRKQGRLPKYVRNAAARAKKSARL